MVALRVAKNSPPSSPATVDAISGSGCLVAVVLAGYPVAWAIGLGPALFALAATFMILWLLRNRPILVPSGTILLALFVALVLASAVQVNSPGRAGVWVLRASWYVSALVMWLYLARQTSVKARRLIVYSLIGAWVLAVGGGLAAMVLPDFSWSSPFSMMLPGVIAGDEYVSDLINPALAEVQTFYPDIRLNRPAAPYAYTNAWGSNVALLTPFMFAALHDRRLRIPRLPVVVALMIGLIPFIYSLNRGAWLTLAIGSVYGIGRYAVVNRRIAPLVVLLVLGAVSLTAVVGTGMVDVAAEQLEARTGDSDETRSGLYLDTIRRSADSPLIGFGTPRPNPSDPSGPPLGTHGQLWAVMFAYGYVAVALYVAFFVLSFLRSRGRDPVTHWAKVSLGIGILQLPIYGHVPTQLFVMVAAAAIAAWPSDGIVDAPPTDDRRLPGRGS